MEYRNTDLVDLLGDALLPNFCSFELQSYLRMFMLSKKFAFIAISLGHEVNFEFLQSFLGVFRLKLTFSHFLNI